jgi:hypothetical protein
MSTIRYRRIMPALFSRSERIRQEWIDCKKDDQHEMDWWVDAGEPIIEKDESESLGSSPVTLVFVDSETNEVYERMYIRHTFKDLGRIGKYVEAEELDHEMGTTFLEPVIQPHPYCTV